MQNEVGYVLSISDSLIFLDGLPNVHINDLIVNEQGIRGVISALLKNQVEVWVLDEGDIRIGQVFKTTNEHLSINVGDFLLGRAINPLGVPIDGKGPVSKTRGVNLRLDAIAPGIQTREFIKSQFTTGITLIDTLIPIGKGQRQLILGDARSGKNQFILDLLLNQSKLGTLCVYAAVGRPISTVKSMINFLQETGSVKNTVVVATSSTESQPLIYHTPYAAMTIAEYFARKGQDVLFIIDDLGVHAKVYRELSLLAGRFPGRQAYPGDIFHTHAKLLERAGNFNVSLGGASITALPIMDITSDDFTTLIPTNLMSMTDGHFLFSSELFGQGFNPAIDIPQSVSRVGRQTQNQLQNSLSLKIRQVLSEGAQLETTSSFAAELPPQTRLIITQKEMIEEIIKQDPFSFMPPIIQLILLGLIFTNFLMSKNSFFLKTNKSKLLKFFEDPKAKLLLKSLESVKSLDELLVKLNSLSPRLEQICHED